jgi:hypothetical protein
MFRASLGHGSRCRQSRDRLGFVTRFVTVVARLTATEGTLCDTPIRLYNDFQWLLPYSAAIGATHWDGGTPATDQKVGGSNPSGRAGNS